MNEHYEEMVLEPIEELLPTSVENSKEVGITPITEEMTALHEEMLNAISEPLFDDTDEENKKSGGSDPDTFDENETILLQSPISIKGNFIYCMERDPQGFDVNKRISNFSLTPLYLIEKENDNVSYFVVLKNQHSTKRVVIDGETLSSNRLFKAFCRSKGSFNWSGTQKQLDSYNDYLIATFNLPIAHEIDYMGFLIDSTSHLPQDPETIEDNVWLFPTHAFYNGEIIYPNEDGVFITPTKNYIFDKEAISNFAASVQPIDLEPTKDDILHLLSNAHILYDNFLWLGIGYMTATQQVTTVQKYMKQFPYFFPAGVRHTGKTEFMNMITKFSGINPTLNTPSKRIDVFRKHIVNHSHLPFGYDEVTPDYFEHFLPELKTLFNRKLVERGDKHEKKLHRYSIRSTLTFSGEVATTESAIVSRTILVDSTKFHHDLHSYNIVSDNDDLILWLGQYMMKRAHEWRPRFVEEMKRFEEIFQKDEYKHILSRIRKNYVIVASGAAVFMKMMEEQYNMVLYTKSFEANFINFLLQQMELSQSSTEEEQECVKYLKNIAHLANTGRLRKRVHYVLETVKDEQNKEKILLFLAHGEAWSALQESKFTTTYTATNQLSTDLEQFHFFEKELKNKSKKMGSKPFRCWVFNLSAENLPEFFHHFISPDWEYETQVNNDYESSRYVPKY